MKTSWSAGPFGVRIERDGIVVWLEGNRHGGEAGGGCDLPGFLAGQFWDLLVTRLGLETLREIVATAAAVAIAGSLDCAGLAGELLERKDQVFSEHLARCDPIQRKLLENALAPSRGGRVDEDLGRFGS
jgi:hypothetical protein